MVRNFISTSTTSHCEVQGRDTFVNKMGNIITYPKFVCQGRCTLMVFVGPSAEPESFNRSLAKAKANIVPPIHALLFLFAPVSTFTTLCPKTAQRLTPRHAASRAAIEMFFFLELGKSPGRTLLHELRTPPFL